MVANVFFELTEAFNAERPTVALAAGQAVVFYRLAIMSKDGDWIVRESNDACDRVLSVLTNRGAHYRPSPPLDPRWLAGGWSSHFEFYDDRHRRVRCDFMSRPPRVARAAVDAIFERKHESPLIVVDLESLIAMKRTQRAKDYAVIGALATLLPPDREVEVTSDPDRLLALAPIVGPPKTRPRLVEAVTRGERRAIVIGLAEEIDDHQQRDRRRVERYQAAAVRYLEAARAHRLGELPLEEAHQRLLEDAERFLPTHLPVEDDDDAE
jgi:hypothetical protein